MLLFFVAAYGEEYTGFLDSASTKKISIPFAAQQTYLVSLESPVGADFDLYVYNSNDSAVGRSMKTSQLDGVIFSTQEADTYRIEIRPVSGMGEYKMSIVTLSLEQGYLNEGDCWQYRLDLKFGDRCYLLLKPAGCNLDLFVYDRYNYLIAKSESPSSQAEELEFRAPLKEYEKYTV